MLCKERRDILWNPQKQGPYGVSNARPLLNEIASYCVDDVCHLLALYHQYRCRRDSWQDFIAEEFQKRVSDSQTIEYQRHGEVGGTLSPSSAEQKRILDSWSEVSKLRDFFHMTTSAILKRIFGSYGNIRDSNVFKDWTKNTYLYANLIFEIVPQRLRLRSSF